MLSVCVCAMLPNGTQLPSPRQLGLCRLSPAWSASPPSPLAALPIDTQRVGVSSRLQGFSCGHSPHFHWRSPSRWAPSGYASVIPAAAALSVASAAAAASEHSSGHTLAVQRPQSLTIPAFSRPANPGATSYATHPFALRSGDVFNISADPRTPSVVLPCWLSPCA
jgi:hypothetical protein